MRYTKWTFDIFAPDFEISDSRASLARITYIGKICFLKRAIDEAAFKAQSKYTTFFGYLFHEEWLSYEE